jgi:uncharacterized membrane protein YqaE (UPF0057 family)
MEWVILFIVFYLAPGIVATQRGHHNALAIWMLNIFLGATVLGWIAALIWACTKVSKSEK